MYNKIWHLFHALPKVLRDYWKVSGANIVHWHLVGATDNEMIDIAWQELHKAELRYKAKWEKLNRNREIAYKRWLSEQAEEYYGKS